MEEIQEWAAGLEQLLARMGPCFNNVMGRRRLAKYVRGLLADVQRKNGWQLAEEAGEATPYAMQQFLYRGDWDPGDVTRQTRRYMIEHLGDADGVLVGDETGFLKKGMHSVGVQRQYSGTAGRVEARFTSRRDEVDNVWWSFAVEPYPTAPSHSVAQVPGVYHVSLAIAKRPSTAR